MSKNDESSRAKAVSRRGFLRLAGVAGSATALSGCLISDKEAGGKGWMPKQYNVPGTWPVQVKGRVPIDPENPSLARDDKKCVLCGQCLEVCQKVQTVYGAYELPVKDDFVCIHCGQCALWCPTAAISERDDVGRVRAALADKSKLVVVQTAPATRVGLGEEFGLPPGSWFEGQQVAALKALGFHKVFDTNFTADLTIMEEGSELVKRLTEKGAGEPLPQLTSCCPGWVKFVEYFYPELIPNLSTAKSPQQMLGALAKTYYAKAINKRPEDIFSVSIMPCTAKKFEATRPELQSASHFNKKESMRDVDAVLTVRELATMMKAANVDPGKLKEERYDSVMGEGSGAALIFGNSGGVMEAAVRGAYFLVTKKVAPKEAFELQAVRGLAGIKEASVEVPGVGALKVAVVSGTKNARALLDRIKKGEASYHFIEVMACPGGCISGGGMPRTSVPPADEVRAKRTASIVGKDASYTLRESYKNEEVKKLYETFLEEPLGHKSHELLHTKYVSRSDKLKAKKPV